MAAGEEVVNSLANATASSLLLSEISRPGHPITVFRSIRPGHDAAVRGEPAREYDRERASRRRVGAVHRLKMHVGFGAVARVAALPQRVAASHRLADRDCDTPSPEVTERDHHPRRRLDQHVVTRESFPPRGDASLLRRRVEERRDAAERRMIDLAVVHADDHAVYRSRDRSPEAGEEFGRLGSHEGAQRDGRRAATFVDRDEVDRVRRGEQPGAVTRNPIGRTVLHQPPAGERQVETDRVGEGRRVVFEASRHASSVHRNGSRGGATPDSVVG
jgi:hypothetical protein